MIKGVLLLISGAALGVGTLSVVKQVSVFGNTCLYVGELSTQTNCLAPGAYYRALGVAGVLVVVGAAVLLKSKQT